MLEGWRYKAACTTNPDAMFVSGADQNVAKRVCRACPVQYECLADALDSRTEYGVWGGMNERERRAVLRDNPDVESWEDTIQGWLNEKGLTDKRRLELMQEHGRSTQETLPSVHAQLASLAGSAAIEACRGDFVAARGEV